MTAAPTAASAPKKLTERSSTPREGVAERIPGFPLEQQNPLVDDGVSAGNNDARSPSNASLLGSSPDSAHAHDLAFKLARTAQGGGFCYRLAADSRQESAHGGAIAAHASSAAIR